MYVCTCAAVLQSKKSTSLLHVALLEGVGVALKVALAVVVPLDSL